MDALFGVEEVRLSQLQSLYFPFTPRVSFVLYVALSTDSSETTGFNEQEWPLASNPQAVCGEHFHPYKVSGEGMSGCSVLCKTCTKLSNGR